LRGLTVRRIAEKIGYAPGTLYNLFANLDEIVVWLNGDTLTRLEVVLVAGSKAPPERRARDLVDAYFDFVEGDPRLWSALFEHRLPADTDLPDWYRERLESLILRVAEALQPVMRDWAPEERRTTIVAMWAALHGISTLAVSAKLSLVADVPARSLGHLLVERLIAAGPGRKPGDAAESIRFGEVTIS
jgi:AcrR family transcriptional regulator